MLLCVAVGKLLCFDCTRVGAGAPVGGAARCRGRVAASGWIRLEGVTIEENVPLASYTTLGVGGPARWFCEASAEDDVVEAVGFARGRGLRLFVLGGGSNVLAGDAGFDGVVVRVSVSMSKPDRVDGDSVFLEVGAGESWDDVVLYATDRGYAGIECLAGIPGDVGGTPVQNVGAYGQEVCETIVGVRAFDLELGEFVYLDCDACGFGYRRSIFNSTARGRYIVTAVTYRLRVGGEPALKYADVRRYFEGRTEAPTLSEVYDAVRAIRAQKGMLAGVGEGSRSAGSFFKNPVVEEGSAGRIAEAAGVPVESVPRWPAGEGMVKVAAAWLVERAGFAKGFAMGRAGISTKHTLALVNLGGATAAEIVALRDAVRDGVEERFGVRLEQEPVEVG
jgi:UDP-N-acetylmuramate dehydrogenase